MVKGLGFTQGVNNFKLDSLPGRRTITLQIFLTTNNSFYEFNFVLKIILFLHGVIKVFGPLKFLKFFV